MQIKMRSLHTYLKKVTILKAGKGAEKVDHSYIAGVKYKNGTQPVWKIVWQFLKKVNMHV